MIQHAIKVLLGLVVLGSIPSIAQGQAASSNAMGGDMPPLCVHAGFDTLERVVAAGSGGLISWSSIADAAIVLEYESVYAVHTPLDPSRPIRSQPGYFFTDQILDDLECFVDPSAYNFLLFYSLQELPGWIHSGPRGIPGPAKNIGLPNSQFGLPSAFPSWPKLFLVPHMNSIELVEQDQPTGFGVLTAMHEMGHAWNVFWAQQSPGPREWQQSDPVAWLGSCCGHWSWNWVDPQMPGMMYSAPTNAKFNEFDLYSMGLLPYDEAQLATYEVYEDPGTGPPGPVHPIGLDDLLFSLSLLGSTYYEGDGHRIPELDVAVSELTSLIVVLKGTDETVSAADEIAIADLADKLSSVWSEATGGRSSLVIKILESERTDTDTDNVLDCIDNCPVLANVTQEDTDDDSIGDLCDPCPHISHPYLWDLDHREGFNLHDFWVFQSCFSGAQPVAPGCSFSAFSGDGRIDLEDFVPIGELMTGNCE